MKKRFRMVASLGKEIQAIWETSPKDGRTFFGILDKFIIENPECQISLSVTTKDL
jgi:hypothetical protein